MADINKFIEWEKKNLKLHQELETAKQCAEKDFNKKWEDQINELNNGLNLFAAEFEKALGIKLTDAAWAAVKVHAATQSKIIMP